MTLFEFTFGLSAVILGLALTQMANSLHRLALGGRRVRWAPEPLLLAGIIFLVIVSVWLFQWEDRDRSEATIGLMLLQVGKMIFPFLGAAFVLPEQVPDTGDLDLRKHYERTRIYTYGSLIIGLVLFWVDVNLRWWLGEMPGAGPFDPMRVVANFPWVFVGVYALLIVVRNRWIHIAVLASSLLFYCWQIAGVRLEV